LARTRSIAISALAASALIFTTSAAVGHAGLHTSTAAASSDSSGMGWARYSGYLTDLSPSTDDVFEGAKASAVMIGMEGSSFFRLQITGIDDSAAAKEYPSHLHKGPCVAGQGASARGHYNAQEEAGLPASLAGQHPHRGPPRLHSELRWERAGDSQCAIHPPAGKTFDRDPHRCDASGGEFSSPPGLPAA
jgi:hypothetical protein